MSKRNVTVALDEETARWARVEAARRDTSVSQMLANLLHEAMLGEESYASAMGSYLSGQPRHLKDKGRYPARESIHDRADLRR